jgi:hypothetical protein
MSAITEDQRRKSDRRRGGTGKRCHRCGQDLAGQVRYRDKSGYWCMPCSKADHKAYRANHLPCDDCGSDVRRGEEFVVEDFRLCAVCNQKRQVEAVRMRMVREAGEAAIHRRRRMLRLLRNWIIVAAELIVAGVVVTHLSKPDAAPDKAHLATSRPAEVPALGMSKQEVHASSAAMAAQTLP